MILELEERSTRSHFLEKLFW